MKHFALNDQETARRQTTALSRIMARTSAPGTREVRAVRGVSFAAYKGEAWSRPLT